MEDMEVKNLLNTLAFGSHPYSPAFPEMAPGKNMSLKELAEVSGTPERILSFEPTFRHCRVSGVVD